MIRVLRKLSWVTHQRQKEAELREELEFHLQREAEEGKASGMTEEEARRAAYRDFGNVTLIAEDTRAVWGWPLLEQLIQDARYASRQLRRNPLFALTAALSLAIGVAANAAIFSLADALFLRTIPGIAEPDRLVEVGRTFRTQTFGNMSYPNYLDFRDRNTVFQELAAYQLISRAFGLGTSEGAERVDGSRVSGNYFAVLGVTMPLGRALEPSDERRGAEPVVVLTDRLWRTRFDGDPAIVGRPIHLNGQLVTIVGVAPEHFTGHNIAGTDLWIPLTLGSYEAGDETAEASRGSVWLLAMGRLKPGVSIEQARAQMRQIARDLESEYPEANNGNGVALSPWRAVPNQVAGLAGGFLAILFALVGVILLIACTNVGGMLLARGVTRAREIAVRLAVGAARSRIVRLLVIESVLLGVAGSVIGVAFAEAFIRLLRSLTPTLPVPLIVDFRLDWRVIAFSVVVSVAAGVLCGLLPALEAARTDLAAAVRPDGPAKGPRRALLRHSFVVAQVAMSVLLVVTAMLLGRSLLNAKNLSPGFAVENVEVTSLNLRLAGYDDTRGSIFVNELVARLERMPNIEAATASMVVPRTTEAIGLGPVWLGGTPFDGRNALFPEWNGVTPEYFTTLTIPIVAGRAFTATDRAGSPAVIIVNETLARRFWPDDDPIGQTLMQRSGGPGIEGRDIARQVIGVAQDATYRSLGEAPQPAAYLPLEQAYWPGLSIVVRTNGQSALATVRALIAEMDPYLPIVQAGTFSDRTAFALLPYRAAAWVAASAGAVGLLLASIGLYSVTAFSASRRTREIGIRVALGATRGQVIRQIVRQSMALALTGAMIGLILAALGAQLLTHLLLGIRPLDPASFLGAAALLAALALTASLVPARRAASVNPVEALRTE